MSTIELLTRFRSLDVKVWIEGEQLRYRAAKGVMTPELHAELAANKEQIIGILRTASTIESNFSAPPIEPAAREEELPLSFAQQRLWFLDQLEPGSPLYNIPFAVQLSGPLDLPALNRALDELISRHEGLRTCFKQQNGEAVQVILPPSRIRLELEHVSTLTELWRLLNEEAQQPFDLAYGPLLRARLFRLSAEEHVLAVTMHHIISDEWSLGILRRELTALYEAYSAGAESPLAELRVQYADYAVWQRNWLRGEVLERELRYWRKQLAGAPALLELPTDHARPAVQTHRGAYQRVKLSAETTRGLKELSRRHNATLFMTALAGFQALLSRWSGTTDVVVGTPVAGRTQGETEAVIGFFVNTLALRTDLSENPTFSELLVRVRDVCLGAYAHQEVPFEKLVEELGVERDLSRTPLFQVMFAWQNASSGEELEMSGVRIGSVQRSTDFDEIVTSKFDLLLTLSEEKDEIAGSLEYNTDLYERATIERLVQQLERVLAAVAVADECRVGELPLLSEAEHEQVVVEWNRWERYEVFGSVVARFEREVERRPDAVALQYETEVLSYAELNRRANQLGHYLRRRGVGPEVRVGLLLERSVEMVVSMLAVLKAGGTYVPLETAAPAERIAFMLEDSGCKLLVTEQGQLEQEMLHPEVLELEQAWVEITSEPDTNFAVDVSEANGAYVIYTSGSTGKPKGVTVTHGNVLRLLDATEAWFRFGSEDVWTMFHSYAFDFSVWELWGALADGGRLVVVPYWVSRTPEAFYELLQREGVTVLNQTPSAFGQLQPLLEKESAGQLRVVIFGGEALELSSLRSWYERYGDAGPQLVNMYGITETTVHVTYRLLGPADVESGRRSVIGKRIPDLELYLLDERQKPVPVGVAGELYVGGGGVARGYVDRAGLTAERFIPHPFSTDPGERLYRTGDLGRYLADGDIEYLGRVDQQVKIRGHRIETGEVAAVLRSHQAVSEAVVLAWSERGNERSEQRLVGYVVANEESEVEIAELRSYLRERLPDYMVPTYLMVLDRLPLTVNGKLDRKRLPRPQLESFISSYQAPETVVEEKLAQIWGEVLGIERVGTTDNFFALGGDSIRSVRVVALAREQGLQFNLQQLFQYQTITELAAVVAESETEERVASEPFSLVRAEDREKFGPEIEDAYPLSMMQAGMLFHSEYERESALYHNYSSYHVRAPYDEEAIRAALERLLQRHAMLRTAFDLTSYSEPLQLVQREVAIPLAIVDVSELSEAEQEAVIAEWQETEKQRYIDWRQAPLLRFQVHRRSAETFQFSFALHHAILDGWSVAAMLTELFGSYLKLLQDDGDEVVVPSSTFRDFVALEQAALKSEECKQYWNEKLSDSSRLSLPRWPSAAAESETHLLDVPVPGALSDRLKQVAERAGVPIKSVLLAAHLRVMSVLGGQSDVVTGVVSHGRPEAIDTERVLGLYLNTLPFRQKLNGGSWVELIKETFESEREMLPYRYYPLAQIKTDQDGHTLFDTIFNFMSFHVYNSFERPDGIEVIDETGFGDTDFAFSADFNLNTSNSEIGLTLSGKSDALCLEQMEAIAGYYSAALNAIAENPHARYDLQPLLSAPERERLLVQWTNTRADYELDNEVHRLFEEQVERAPNAVAITHEDEHLSYAQLNEYANQIAHYLQINGIGPDDRVAICLERSPRTIAALLGVLKAGAAYVPLDPNYPLERIRYILDDAKASILITQQHLRASLISDAKVLCLDSDHEALSTQPVTNPDSSSSASNLAYIIYTSGSTGEPKGVMIPHEALADYVRTATEIYEITSLDRVLQFCSISFDTHIEEIFCCLLQGGTLVLRTDEMMSSADKFLAYCDRQGVTFITLPTAYWHAVTAEVPARAWEQVRTLRLLILGGESALAGRVDSFVASQGERVRLMNTYGPTETTVIATMGEIAPGTPFETIGIGKPVANTEVYVLDESLLPVPVGVSGELYIGGRGVARGYLDRPALTAERFIPDPFSVDQGQLLYRTGDRVRYLPNGNLQFLNRLDDQVKIRGNRIEIGEIEARLREHKGVRDVAVVARDEGQGDRRLVAYIVAGDEIDGEAALFQDLRGFLLERLPDYMIPAAWVRLEKLPLTPNGKLDRKGLPDPGQPTSYAGESFAAPRTMIEEVLTAIWRRVLNLERVSRDAHFFLLGGHSLVAMQIISRIRDSFQVEVPLRSLFETPVLWELAERIEAWMKADAIKPAPQIQHVTDSDRLPLSFAQQRLWVLDQLIPGSNAYNLPAEMSIDIDLKVGALEQALNEVVRRHEALRTTILLDNGTPVQKINPPGQFRLSLIDLSSLGAAEREVECERLRQEDWLRPFDLVAGPLLRAKLIRLGDAGYLFLLNMHHIISDGWSMGVLLQEMETLYEAFSRGLPSPLPELHIQYSDYARWQRQWLQGDILKEEVEYWRQRLDGAPTLLELETDHPRPAMRSVRGAHYPVVFSEQLSRSLKDYSREEGATLFMTLMAGFHALLRRYTGQNDVLIGTPIAGRSRAELEPLIGFFVNMIPLRTSFSGDPTFRDLVRQVRESSFAAYTHQELPFDKLVEELQPKRAPGRNPMFQAILALSNDAPEMEMAKVSRPAGAPVSADVKFDLEVHLSDGPNGLTGTFVYSPELFDESLISRMAGHFQRLFERVLAAPDKELSAISLLDEAEYRQVVETWNDTKVAFPDQQCIHEFVQQEAEQRPDAIALEFGDHNITYAGLNNRANRLAHRLRAHGTGDEALVGVMLERSADLILALLATAKAGGVYVPIKLSDPPARIRFIFDDGVKTLLTTRKIAESLPDNDLTIVCIDSEDPHEDLLYANENPAYVDPDSLAYLMYTSGSTGMPKGVGITHRNIAALVKNTNYARLNSEEIFLQLAPSSFDASTFEIWACLLNGARLVIYPAGTPSLSELGEFVARTQVTTLFLTTGLFHQFIDTNVKGTGAVKQLLTGGDVLSPAHLAKAVEQIEDCSFVNCYGPTEATVMACAYQVGPSRPAASVPIGRPISNSRVYIINGMQPAGVGERGELFIGGAGLGRGYHNRPDLTAERFIPDSYGPEPGARLYRTGDAARYLNTGLIQFLGRVDDQIKISGFRIEPGEIETVLCSHPDVTSALVLAREDTPGNKRLVAYVVAGGQPQPASEELRNFLRERVPEYMVPSAVMMLDALPLTAHGKVDQSALPAPQFITRSGREYVAARNGLQQQLVDIWEELFKLHPIGITDDFFELGGHSLMMIMLVARIEERLGKRVVMAELFTDPTIEHLSELIGHGKETLFQSLVVPMQPEGINPPFFSPHASGGNLWCYRDLAQHIGSEQPFYGVQPRTPETGLVLHTEIEVMAAEYIEAMRGVQPAGPYFLGGWSMGGVIAFEMARQLQEQGETIGLLALIDSHAPSGEQLDHNWALLLSTFVLDLGLSAEDLQPLLKQISTLPPMTQLRKVWAHMKSFGLIPSDMTLIEFRKTFDIFKINANTVESYRPRQYRGKITLFTSEEDIALNLFVFRNTDRNGEHPDQTSETEPGNPRPVVLKKGMVPEGHSMPTRDPFRGWQDLATEGVDLHAMPGDHFSMIREPHVSVLAEQLRVTIESSMRELQLVVTP